MSKYVQNSINNISINKGHFNPLSVYYNTLKIFKKEEFQKNKKNETISLNSTSNIINKKNINNYSSVTFNNTYSNENKKETKRNTLFTSLNGSMSKGLFSVSQGYPKLSKSFNKKYKNNKNNESNYMNYLKPKDNKYKGIDLNLISNSSHRKNENNITYFRDKINLKKINDKNEEKNIDLKNNEEKAKKNKDTIEDKNIFDKMDIDKNSEIKSRMDLNSSITSKQNSKIENISINQSTPVSNFHPYEADSSPTNYIKSYSNINNLTFLTNNNKKLDNKNEEEEKSTISHFKLNQSEFTYLNYSNKISEKEEEKSIGDKLEKMNKYKKDKRKKKGIKKENYNKGYCNKNNYENPLSRNKIEEKEEEYINSLNNKLQISKKNNINEIKDSKNQDSICYNKKTEGNKKERNENVEMELSNESIKEKSMKDKLNIEIEKEENINSYKKEEKEKENELEKKEKKMDNLYSNNFEFNDELFEIKIKNKNEEIKNGKEKVKNRIRIKDTNFINNVNQIALNDPKYTINAKLNFNYYSVNNCKEGNNNKTESKEINQINYNNLKNELKEKYPLFYDYGTSATIHRAFQRPSINNKYKYFNNDLNKLEEKKENYNINESKNKIKPEMQFQIEISTKKEEKKENRNTLSSFNFGIIKRGNSYCKKKIIRKCLINDTNKENININKKSNELNLYKNNIINNKDLKEKILKDSSTQYSNEILDENNNSYLPINDYINNSEYINYSKNKLKNKYIKRNILFDFEGFKTNYELINKQTEYNKEDKKLKNEPITSKIEIKNKIINNFPHHNKIGRNKWTLSNEYSLNNINSNSRTKIGQKQGFFSIDKTNKFNRKLNSSVLPANPFDSINKAREYFFFNN